MDGNDDDNRQPTGSTIPFMQEDEALQDERFFNTDNGPEEIFSVGRRTQAQEAISAERQRFAHGQWDDALMNRGGNIAPEAPIGTRGNRCIAPEAPIHASGHSTFDFDHAGRGVSSVADARIWNQDPTRVGNNNNNTASTSASAAQRHHINQSLERAGRGIRGYPTPEDMARIIWNQAQADRARGGGLTFPDSNIHGSNISGQAAGRRGVAQNTSASEARSSISASLSTHGLATAAPMAPAAPMPMPMPAVTIPTASIFITLQTIQKAENGTTWHLICEEHIAKRPETKQLRQGRSIPPPAASAEWNVWTVGSLEFEHVQGGLHLDYLREVLLRQDGVSRKKVNRATLVSLVRAERCRQINSGMVVRCPVGWVEDGHWYIYVQPI
ncbi:uncharacterized protein LAJ45_05988 [Morchella importuna]|uniref:uncharacterized protein n=1 Tax=Morchella importuna TaxID=1174673 RepID=UPI001E8DA9DC|nr:uncharacterized protein LAJ45_05988 [Morchella importuna]KAH8149836.1 hypothetical protein LAJ45_05988 [Morchella importuna]